MDGTGISVNAGPEVTAYGWQDVKIRELTNSVKAILSSSDKESATFEMPANLWLAHASYIAGLVGAKKESKKKERTTNPQILS